MRKILKILFIFVALYQMVLSVKHGSVQVDGAVFTEKWDSIGGFKIKDLTSHSTYPDSPNETYNMATFFLGRTYERDFGMRMRSYFQAPMTGNYSFHNYLCDDSCMVYLSISVNPKDKKIITDHSPGGKGIKSSQPVYLEEGKLYYLEMLFKQGNPYAEFNLYVCFPDGKGHYKIPSKYLKKSVSEIDRPGKDCTKSGDPKFPDYINCKDFTRLDKLNAVKTVLKQLQTDIRTNPAKPSMETLEDSMKTAARKITFLLDDTESQQSDQVEKEDGGIQVAMEVEHLGNMVAEQLNQTEPMSLEYPNIILQIKKLEKNFIFPDKSLNASFQTDDEISISTNQSDSEDYLVFSSLYKNLEDLLKGNISEVDGDEKGNFFLNSRIIASSLIPAPNKSLEKKSVRLKLEHKRFKSSKKQAMMCVFWNFTSSGENSTGSWSNEGCQIDEQQSNENFTVCLCDHLTHFAILMKVTEDDKPLSEDHVTALQAITYVGCSLSLIGEVLTIVTLTCLRLTKETNMIHLNLVVALGLAQIFFLSGITATENKAVCTFVAVALHFFNLVAFFWMLVEGLWLYVMVVRVFDTGYNRIKRYVIAAWTIPAVIVVVTLVSSFDGYGTKHSCWLSVEKGTIWSFAAPVLIIVLINTVILALVVREILRLHNPAPTDDSKLQTVRSGIKSTVVLLPILGIAWVFGILAVNSQTLAFQYLFAIFNSLQGFLIFIFHCVLNSEVRKTFRRKKQIWSDNQIFNCHSTSTPQPKYDSELSKETRSTTNGVEKRPHSSTSTSKIIIK